MLSRAEATQGIGGAAMVLQSLFRLHPTCAVPSLSVSLISLSLAFSSLVSVFQLQSCSQFSFSLALSLAHRLLFVQSFSFSFLVSVFQLQFPLSAQLPPP